MTSASKESRNTIIVKLPKLILILAACSLAVLFILLVSEMFFLSTKVSGSVEGMESSYQERIFSVFGDSFIIMGDNHGRYKIKVPRTVYEEVRIDDDLVVQSGRISGVTFFASWHRGAQESWWFWLLTWFSVELIVASIVFFSSLRDEDAALVVGFVFLAGAWGTMFTWI